ncbi:MAG: Hint domain-containing protein [Pseudomonadota bacterium]
MLGNGAFAQIISAVQTRVDGEIPSTRNSFFKGSTFRWFGLPLRLDGARESLLLDRAIGFDDLRQHAPNGVAKLCRARSARPEMRQSAEADRTDTLTLGDGTDRWRATALTTATGELLLAFDTDLPPANRDLIIEQAPVLPHPRDARQTICFTPGTMVDTPDGPHPIDVLYPGDEVLTRDDGPQEILWMGLRYVSGARLYAQPDLRPVRLRAGALGGDRPEPDLIVSPDHRILLTDGQIRALWDTDEALIRARDLIDDSRVMRDHGTTETTYIHILLARHQVIRANGVWVESFHPDDADLTHLNPVELEELREAAPDAAYGPHARRCLSPAELAILRHDGAPRHLA